MSMSDENESSTDFESCDESMGESYETCEEDLSLRSSTRKRMRSRRAQSRNAEGQPSSVVKDTTVASTKENLFSIVDLPLSGPSAGTSDVCVVVGECIEISDQLGIDEALREVLSITSRYDSILGAETAGNDGQHDLIGHPVTVSTSISPLPEANYRNNSIVTAKKDEQSNPLRDDENRIKFVQSNGTNNHLIPVSVDDSQPRSIADVSLFEANSVNSVPGSHSGQVGNEVGKNEEDLATIDERQPISTAYPGDAALLPDLPTEGMQESSKQDQLPVTTVQYETANEQIGFSENVCPGTSSCAAHDEMQLNKNPTKGVANCKSNNSAAKLFEDLVPSIEDGRNLLSSNPQSVLVLETMVNKKMQLSIVIDSQADASARGRKLHLIRDHLFIARRISVCHRCHVCKQHFPWRLGKQGYQCRQCHLLCHKACHVRVVNHCSNPIDLSNHLQ